MKVSQYLAIAVRLFSIMLFITGLRQLMPLIELMISGTVSGMAVSYFFAVAMSLIPILFSLFLWFFPISISASIIKQDMEKEIVPLSQVSWLVVILIGIGLYTLYYAISDSLSWLYYWHMSTQSSFEQPMMELRGEDKANMFITFLELVASLFLVFKAKTLSHYLLKVSS